MVVRQNFLARYPHTSRLLSPGHSRVKPRPGCPQCGETTHLFVKPFASSVMSTLTGPPTASTSVGCLLTAWESISPVLTSLSNKREKKSPHPVSSERRGGECSLLEASHVNGQEVSTQQTIVMNRTTHVSPRPLVQRPWGAGREDAARAPRLAGQRSF